jgi:hypothetical protein
MSADAQQATLLYQLQEWKFITRDNAWLIITTRENARQRETTRKEQPNTTWNWTSLTNNREWWRSMTMRDQL